MFLARLEFLHKTGCVPHYFQYKEVTFLFFPQNVRLKFLIIRFLTSVAYYCCMMALVHCLLPKDSPRTSSSGRKRTKHYNRSSSSIDSSQQQQQHIAQANLPKQFCCCASCCYSSNRNTTDRLSNMQSKLKQAQNNRHATREKLPSH